MTADNGRLSLSLFRSQNVTGRVENSGLKRMIVIKNSVKHGPSTEFQRGHLTASVINDIISWIEAHLCDEKISVRAVTNKSGYGHWHFQRIFREYTGCSLGEYIRRRRVINAACALFYTDNGIIDIAIAHGFTSQQTFSRTFRQYFDIPPALFRKQYIHREEAFSRVINTVFE